MTVAEGELLWQPSGETRSGSAITRYLRWLGESRGRSFGSYGELWEWSTTDLEGFWGSLWDWAGVVAHRPPERVLGDRRMPGAEWFPGAELNHAEHALRRRDDHPALVCRTEDRRRTTTSYAELAHDVAAFAAHLRRLGVGPGDLVAAWLPNIPETVTAFLATASLGAVWSTCAPEFGARSVADRFRQLEPTVLLAVDGYRYGGRPFPRLGELAALQRELPGLGATVVVPLLDAAPDLGSLDRATLWPDLRGEAAPDPVFAPVPFGHPLWVLYSSGATGLPKGIVHGHGGILLEHLKSLLLHLDVRDGDRFFWFTTTGWMMWNRLVSGLLLGVTVVLYDGSPAHPDPGALWRLAEEERVTHFGAGAPFLVAAMRAGRAPGREYDLSAMRFLGSTGAPLPPEAFRWVYDRVKQDVLLGSISGGTDVCTGLLGSCPLLPVHAGEIQCRCLGVRAEAWDAGGRPVVDEVGELVVTEPMPSMPTRLWGDPDGDRYRRSYFAGHPGVWRHGDWVKITSRGSCVVYGRSDATLNRGGVRMGTSEFYRVVEELPEVEDSLVVHVERGPGDGRLLLFVVTTTPLDDDLRSRIAGAIRTQLSPRHVPDEIVAVGAVPRTLNGKKLEVPVRRILMGTPPGEAVSTGAMADPLSLEPFVALAGRLGAGYPAEGGSGSGGPS
jgi:acetoacetyl-CoA synthetase